MANLKIAVREQLEPSNEPTYGRMGIGGAGQDQERLRHEKHQGNLPSLTNRTCRYAM
jgi:hypothetical protein